MKIKFNGNTLTIDDNFSLFDFLMAQASAQDFSLDASITAVNLQFVHKEDYSSYTLKEGDDIEFLTAVVGG
jgi:thiamine biosynthesis protein ThiS